MLWQGSGGIVTTLYLLMAVVAGYKLMYLCHYNSYSDYMIVYLLSAHVVMVYLLLVLGT